MSIFAIIMLSFGLAADAFAASVSEGLKMDDLDCKKVFSIALFFGFFQSAMPFIGVFLGRHFESTVSEFAPVISFILLSFIGGKMMYSAIMNMGKSEKSHEKVISFSMAKENLIKENSLYIREKCKTNYKSFFKNLTVLAVATSIDAFSVGITLPLLNVSVPKAISLFGVITFLLSFIGVFTGYIFGTKLKSKAELTGGIILVLIGINALL